MLTLTGMRKTNAIDECYLSVTDCKQCIIDLLPDDGNGIDFMAHSH